MPEKLLSAWQNYIVFKTTELFNDKVKMKGIGGRDLVIDKDFDPARHVRIHGEVVSVPKSLGKVPISQVHSGLPSYHDFSPFSYKLLSDIVPEVEVGDTIYFHFNTIIQKNFIHIEGVHPDRTWFIKVRYDNVICAVRNGQIVPIGGYVLVEPDMETWEEILRPVYSSMKGPDGKPILMPKDKWIQTKVEPEARYLTGFVRHVGTPLKGETNDLTVGEKIWYRRNANWKLLIEGKEYYCIRQRHIIGRESDGEFIPTGDSMLLVGDDKPSITPGGIHIKQEITTTGVVSHSGRSSHKPGSQVLISDSDRMEVDLKGKKHLVVNRNHILGEFNEN